MKKNNFFQVFILILKEIILNFNLFFCLTILVGVIHSLLTVYNIIQIQRFFESIELVIQINNFSSLHIYIELILLCIVLIFSVIFNGLHNYMFESLMKKVEGKLQYKLHCKCGKISAIDYEKTDILDMIYKASQGMKSSFSLVMMTIFIGTFYLPYILFYAVYLYKLDKILLISLFIIFVPVLLSQFIRNKVYENLYDSIAPIKRQNHYFSKCIGDREFFKETRVLGIDKFFLNKFMDTLHHANQLNWKAKKKMGFVELFCNFLNAIGYIGVVIILVYLLIDGKISIGAFAAIFSSIETVYGILYELVARQISNIVESWRSVKNFISFMNLEEFKELKGSLNSSGIILKNVSFKYPNNDSYALQEININIKKGETIAIVGTNGSGKSTLAKIICGLYEPISGQKVIDLKGSAVFQDFQKYKLSLRDNLYISDFHKQVDETYVFNQLTELGLSKETMPDGLETILSNEFNGIDLSGGQWQKIAIMRGIYRDSAIIVLDEPTAAIDPIEESRMYKMFSEITKDRTTILITHRLGSVKIADRIIVLDKGRVVEEGEHFALMKKRGVYYQLFHLQAHWYDF